MLASVSAVFSSFGLTCYSCDFSRGFKIKRNKDNSGTPSVSATLYACNIGERAYEWVDKGHGVLSYYFTGRVEEAANSKGEIVVTDLAEYTQREVMPWAEDFRGKKQPPWLDQSGGAKLVLVETRLGVVQAEQSRLEEIGSGAATTATSPTGQERGSSKPCVKRKPENRPGESRRRWRDNDKDYRRSTWQRWM